MAVMYAIYVLTPDHKFCGRMADLAKAKGLARALVEQGYDQAEVWDAIIPVYTAWRVGSRRSYLIHTSDDLVA